MFGLPYGEYGAVLVDPPWSFSTWSQTRQTRAAVNHYDVMTLDDIKRLPVADLAAPDCALFMWATNPMLPQALEVMKAWSFEYKTVAFCWAKTTPRSKPSRQKWHMGMGYWTRANVELCLLGTRGKPLRGARNVRQLQIAPRRQHSRKPDASTSTVEACGKAPWPCTSLAYLER